MDDTKLLQAKLEDLIVKAESHGCVCTHFLSPKESFHLQNYIKFHHPDVKCFTDGGYPDAERRLIFILADYFDASFVCKEDHYRMIRVQGSGYYSNTHRDYLGALLGLGLSREMIGDIYVDGYSAYIFVLPKTYDFLLSDDCKSLTVGRDKVKVLPASLNLAEGFKRDFEIVPALCSSLRLDCVVCAVIGISRDKCEKSIAMGLVTHNYEVASKAHAEIKDGDVISVKGYGKFVINLTESRSKKGKIRINAMKYI